MGEKRKIIIFLLCTLVISSFTTSISAVNYENHFYEKLYPLFVEKVDRLVQTIFVNTSAIDDRTDLDETNKTLLKNKILQHIRNNYEDAMGAENVTVTNDPAQEANANRTVFIDPNPDPRRPRDAAWGRTFDRNGRVKVYLGEFMDYPVDNFKNPDGTWNITALSNAIGHTAGHEVGHSYSCGHNFETNTSGPGGTDNRSKMTDGTNIRENERAHAEFLFDEYCRQRLREHWGRPPCSTSDMQDYDERVIISHFWDETYHDNRPDEYGTLDTIFTVYEEMPGTYELGFLGDDTDNGYIDGNQDFDFICKSKLLSQGYQDTNVISFLHGVQDISVWLLREIDDHSNWYIMQEDNVALSNPFKNPDGDTIFRELSITWPEQGVFINFNTLVYGADSCPYNGFTFELPPENNPPNPPTISGPKTGTTDIIYDYEFTNCVDPDSDDMTYYIEWGDNGVDEGFVESGGAFTLSHIWTKEGDYTIRAKLVDDHGAESDWATLDITIPRIKITINYLLERFWQNHPFLEKLLKLVGQ